jgi:hypothetical protein
MEAARTTWGTQNNKKNKSAFPETRRDNTIAAKGQMLECSFKLVNQFISTKKPIGIPSSIALLITRSANTKRTCHRKTITQ